MIMTVQKYSLNVVYRPGKELVLADTLSRAFLQDDDDSLEEKFEVNTLSVIPMSDNKLTELKDQTEKDKQLQQLMNTIKLAGQQTKKMPLENVCHFGNSEMSFQYLTISF